MKPVLISDEMHRKLKAKAANECQLLCVVVEALLMKALKKG